MQILYQTATVHGAIMAKGNDKKSRKEERTAGACASLRTPIDARSLTATYREQWTAREVTSLSTTSGPKDGTKLK